MGSKHTLTHPAYFMGSEPHMCQLHNCIGPSVSHLPPNYTENKYVKRVTIRTSSTTDLPNHWRMSPSRSRDKPGYEPGTRPHLASARRCSRYRTAWLSLVIMTPLAYGKSKVDLLPLRSRRRSAIVPIL